MSSIFFDVGPHVIQITANIATKIKKPQPSYKSLYFSSQSVTTPKMSQIAIAIQHV